MMQQMMENPSAMQNFTSAPYVQSMIESMEQDPDMAMRLLNMNPTLSRNPQLQVGFSTSCFMWHFILCISCILILNN